jgi:hypothetical protein
MKVLFSPELDRCVVVNAPHEENDLPQWPDWREVKQFASSVDFPKTFYNPTARERRTVYSAEDERKLPPGWSPEGAY